jgi:hypothetical protein
MTAPTVRSAGDRPLTAAHFSSGADGAKHRPSAGVVGSLLLKTGHRFSRSHQRASDRREIRRNGRRLASVCMCGVRACVRARTRAR